MNEEILMAVGITFIKVMSPIVAILSLLLFLSPLLFKKLDKMLSVEIGIGKLRRKTVDVLEKEHMILQDILLRYSRIVGLVTFVFAIIVIVRLSL